MIESDDTQVPAAGADASPEVEDEDAPSTHRLPPPAVRVLQKGDEVGRYRIERVIGEGGMGRVYRAEDPQLGRFVALKVLRPRLGPQEEDDRKRLLREAQAMAKLTHPNLVRVYDVGTYDEQIFVAMEYVDGRTLDAWFADPRSWREILEVFVEAGNGLCAVHDAGLVHRDFKPGNVMVGDDGRVLVLDFGLARAADDRPASDSPKAAVINDQLGSELTQAGGIVGTPAYMAPEQHLGVRADMRTDQFSFCVSLYEALYGKRPFSGKSPLDLMEAALAGLRSVPPAVGDMPISVRHAIRRGMQPERDDRFASMPALLAVIEEALVVDKRPRRRGWIAGGALAVALTAGVTWRLATGSSATATDRTVPLQPATAGASGGEQDAVLPQVEDVPPPSVPSVDAQDPTTPVALPSVDELPGPQKLDLPAPDLGTATDAGNEPEAESDSSPEPANEPDAEPETEVPPDAEPETEPPPEPEPQPEPEPPTEPEADPPPKPGELPSL